MSPSIKATAVRIAVKPHGLTVADWHTSPGRQLVLWLTGWSEYETSDGDVRRVPAGSAVLSEDTRGKGHISRHPEEEQVLVFVAVPDGSTSTFSISTRAALAAWHALSAPAGEAQNGVQVSAGPPPHSPSGPGNGLSSLRYACFNTCHTCSADHVPPRAAGIPRAFKPCARARIDTAPAARISSMTGAKSAARASAFATRADALAAFPAFA